MNCLSSQSEEKQFIYYDFIKKMYIFFYKTMKSNADYEVIIVYLLCNYRKI